MGQCQTCCYAADRGTELNDGNIVEAPAFSKSDVRLWDEVDDIFYKYDENMDDTLNKEELTPYL